MSDNETEGASQQTQAQKKGKFPCIICKKNVAKNSKSVRCGTCQLWVHVDCENISAELFNILSHPEKYGGCVTWTCDSCTASNTKLEQYVKGCIDRVKNVEDRLGGTESNVKELGARMERVEDKMKEKDEAVKKLIDQGGSEVWEEMREREVRRRNVILYRVHEHQDERASGADRMTWDKEAFLEICNLLGLGIEEDDIRFCRRVGERGDGARPMIVGLYSEETKFKLLRRAKQLEGTDYGEVTIAQDLTKRQRGEENEMQQEAARRNEDLTEDELAKNVQWAVVGAKGEKRLIRTTARDQTARGAYSQRSRANMSGRGWTRGRGAPPSQNRGQPRTNRGAPQTGRGSRGANYQPLGTRGRGGVATARAAEAAEKRPRSTESEEEMEIQPLSKK